MSYTLKEEIKNIIPLRWVWPNFVSAINRSSCRLFAISFSGVDLKRCRREDILAPSWIFYAVSARLKNHCGCIYLDDFSQTLPLGLLLASRTDAIIGFAAHARDTHFTYICALLTCGVYKNFAKLPTTSCFTFSAREAPCSKWSISMNWVSGRVLLYYHPDDSRARAGFLVYVIWMRHVRNCFYSVVCICG